MASERIAVPGTYNFREVAGFETAAGTVRAGKLFRSDGLGRLGAPGRRRFSELGIRHVVDLRDDFEVDLMPDDLEGLGLEVTRLPVFEAAGGASGAHPVTLDELYRSIVVDHPRAVADAVRHIAVTGCAGVLVHCTAGKDRTGVVVAMALSAVGVDRDVVVDDYAASSAYLDGEWLDGMLAMIADNGVEVTPSLRVLVGGSPPEAMDALLGLVDAEYGGVRDYLLGAGLTLHELSRLEDALLARR